MLKNKICPLIKKKKVYYLNFKYLLYHFKGSAEDLDFNDFIDAETLFDDAKFKIIRFEDVEKDQIRFKLKLNSGRIGGNNSEEYLKAAENIMKFYNSQEEVIKFYND